MLLFIEIVLKSEIRFSDSLCHDICIVGASRRANTEAAKLGPKSRLSTPSPALDFPVPGVSEGRLFVPVSEIRRRILIGQPRFRDFQRPRHFFLPGRGRPPPHSHPDGMSSRVRVQSRVEKIRIVLYPDGECSVKCQWGIRIRLKAFAVTQKQTAAASPTAVTAALQGTPWRGDTPRRGLSASSCSDWDGPHLASLNHGCAERGVASLLGSGELVALGCCGQI